MRTSHDTAETPASEGPVGGVAALDFPAPVIRKGLAGAIAEFGEQRRARARDAFERERVRKNDRLERKLHRQTGSTRTDRLIAVAKDLPGRLLGAGVSVGWLMALVGSGVGQVAWWSSQFPLWLAGAFAVAFEAIMIGAGRKARDRRMKHRPAVSLRLVAWSAATTAAGLNWFHLSNPDTVIRFFGAEINGSTQLGAAFALFTAAGFLVHELAENAAVNDKLRDDGHIHPLGARWLFLPSAIRARLLMIDRPGLTADEAWEQVRRPSRARWTVRAAFVLGRATRRQDKPEKPKKVKKQKPAEDTAAEQTSGQADELTSQPADGEDAAASNAPTREPALDDTAPIERVVDEPDAPHVDEQAATAAEDAEDQDAQLAQLAAILATGQEVTGARAGEMFGCSERTGRRLVNKAKRLHARRPRPTGLGQLHAVGQN